MATTTRYEFLVNLRSTTAEAAFRSVLGPTGYLVPPQTAGRALQDFLQGAEPRPTRVLVDNGNFEWIGKVRQTYGAQAAKLYATVQKLQKRLGRSPRAADIPERLRTAYRRLARDSAGFVGSHCLKDAGVLQRQLKFSPTHVIGAEDLSMAVWLGLNIEPLYLGYERDFYGELNRGVEVRARRVRDGLPDSLRDGYYPVISAVSYDTACDAGALLAAKRWSRAAMGFGAFMSDDNYSDFITVGGRDIALPQAFPNRYVRTVAVARGLWDAYGRSGARLKAFHFLGLGAPIMLPLVALCAWGTQELTFDATSPMRDAVEGSIYVDNPALLKLRTRKIVLAMAVGRSAWDCPCGFCRAFLRRHPTDTQGLRRWFARSKPEEIRAEDLRPGGALFKLVPLFSEPRGGPLRREVDFARMGHNHWILTQCLAGLRGHRTRRELARKVKALIDAYCAHSNSPVHAASIAWAYRLALEGEAAGIGPAASRRALPHGVG